MDRAIREATSALLSEVGYARLTVEGVAARSGVAKTTIYRRWPSKAELVFGTTVHPDELGPAPDTGSFYGDLTEVMGHIVVDLSTGTAGEALLGILVDMAREPALEGTVRERFVGSERRWMEQILGRAVERGEISAGRTDPDLVLDLLLGPIFSRLFVTGGGVDRQLGRRVVDVVAAGLAPSTSIPPRKDTNDRSGTG